MKTRTNKTLGEAMHVERPGRDGGEDHRPYLPQPPGARLLRCCPGLRTDREKAVMSVSPNIWRDRITEKSGALIGMAHQLGWLTTMDSLSFIFSLP
jgi:hypothetical protein